ncbi:uncharacterized protein LOC106719787 [Papilio machaon]|uniref:uncharacterized protein LOC106719787 n=1 Tax=Papilio machaon TaxID=76193 RepID=UPI001E664285|nr:uncharacterized protein LOC106719787 [Papilio machaon]
MPSTLDESGCPMYSILMDNNSSNVAVQCDPKKQYENISYVKQKMLETDFIIRQYKKNVLFEKSGGFDRLNSPDGYTEDCTFNVAATNELAVGLSKEKAELEVRLASTEIKIQEMKSHINQLQMLVTEYETQIEALKIENQLQKCNTKEYNNMINDICLLRDIVLGKKKMQTRHKKVLKKYDKYKSTASDNASEGSVDELDIFNQSSTGKASKKSSKNKTSQAKGLLIETNTASKKIEKGNKLLIHVNGRQDSDSGNEIINEDSGFSSFGNSPDYYPTNSPCSTSLVLKEKKNYVDIATSPITVQKEVEVITHPLDIIENHQCISCSQLSNNLQTEKTYSDIATSPLTVQEYVIEIVSSDKDSTDTDNLSSERSQNEKPVSDEPNRINTVQENQVEINDEAQDCATAEQLACSEMENYLNDLDEIVSDQPLNDRPQEEKNTGKANETSTVQENLEDIMNDDKDNVSLCDSDIIEGCLFGQDSFETDIPLDNETNQKHFSDVATSPITVQGKLVEIATSPVQFIDCIPNNLHDEVTIKKATFANRHVDKNKTIGINTIQIKQREIATSPIKFDHIPGDQESTIRLSERECLELNNSKNNNNCIDCEVESILRTMRLDCELITPIPKSPSKSQKVETNFATCHRCQDMAKLEKENKNLQLTLQEIAKSMSNMTWLIKSRGVLVNNNLHNDNKESCDFVMDDFTPPIASNVNIRDCNNAPENITNDLLSSVAIRNKAKVADIIKILEFGENENHLNNNKILNNEHQPLSNIPISNSIQKCDNKNPVSNKQVLNKSNETASDRLHSEEINEDQPISNTDLIKSCEVQKDIDENDIDQSCNMNVDEQNVSQSPTKKVKKVIKLTKLEKWKRKLLPKSKIRRELTPPIRKDKKRKQILKKKVIVNESPKPAIDTNAAYKKAVEVMAELRDKEKNKTVTKPCVVKALEKRNECNQEVLIVLSKCDDIIQKQTCEVEETTAINDNTVQKETHVTVEKNPTSPSVTTRSRSKRLSSELFNSPKKDSKRDEQVELSLEKENSTSPVRRGRKRRASDRSESTPKRLLRGSAMQESSINKTDNSNTEVIKSLHKDSEPIVVRRTSSRLSSLNLKDPERSLKEIINYNDLDVLTGPTLPENNEQQTCVPEKMNPKDSILCRMLEKYARTSVKFQAKKIPEAKVNMIARKLEEDIANIITIPQYEAKNAMNDLVDEIQHCDKKVFVTGLMKYLKEPARKDELFNKVIAPPAPLMTKSEQVLLYILKQLQACWAPLNIVETIMKTIEFSLFQLNHTPEFGIVESLSHFYAVLCRYFSVKSRLRLFMLDAMYCIQFKSVALIKQCLEVWMHILPLAHMGMAKCPLVMCLIYLLHFFKCEDKFNRVQEIREILSRKYFYQVKEWTEPKMLEMFKNALLELCEIPVEKKMLRLAFIILAKRRGPHWTQKYIIKDMIQPLIEKAGVPDKVKEFCVSILGPLMKPYPNDMRVHCEVVVNQLMEMLDHNAKPSMQEAIFTSLLYMRRHNPSRVNQALFTWSPRHLTPELEHLLKDYVREKPAKVWKHILSKITII